MKPLANFILIDPAEPEGKTAGGLHLPKLGDQNKPCRGHVVAVGPGTWQGGVFVETSVKVGDQVVYARFNHQEVDHDKKKMLLMRESDVLAVI